jgi:hypothetical protein
MISLASSLLSDTPLAAAASLVPISEAVTAEACKLHQVDVLHVAALPQMLDEPGRKAAASSSVRIASFIAGLVAPIRECWHSRFLA